MAVTVWLNHEAPAIRISGGPGSTGCVDIHFESEAEAHAAYVAVQAALGKATGIKVDQPMWRLNVNP
jgi:hypothetical protein